MLSLCLIEDTEKLWTLIQETLIDEGFLCDRYTSVEAFPTKHISRYHIFLLDINLPGTDGVTFAKELREVWPMGIIFLTAKGSLSEKEEWFATWADDYIVKPFSPKELIMRIDALSSRLTDIHYFEYKDIYIDWKHHEAKRWSTHIHLTPIEREVLGYMLRYVWLPCQRSDIIDHVWWYDAMFSMSRSLDVTIARLRNKLDKELIETISWVWYKINKST